MPNPLEEIRDWLGQLPAEARQDIGAMIPFFLEGSPPPDPAQAEAWLASWIAGGLSSKATTVGRALTFRALLDYHYSSRFDPKSWEDNRAFFQRTLDEGLTDPESNAAGLVKSARNFLAELPAKQDMWARIEPGWRSLEAKLTPAALHEWDRGDALESSDELTTGTIPTVAVTKAS